MTRPYRKVLLLVNPVGGKGKARQIVKEEVLPIFEAAWCKVDMRGELLCGTCDGRDCWLTGKKRRTGTMPLRLRGT